MAILNQASDGTLSLLVALWRAVALIGPTQRKRLLAFCGPPSLTDGKKLGVTLTRWTQLGVFLESEDGTIQLADPFGGIPPEDIDTFRMALLPAVIAGGRSAATDAARGETAARDFNEAAAWLCMQDPFEFSSDWPSVERLEDQQGIKVFSNNSRWAGYRAWGPFLGVSLRASRSGILLNPACSIRSVLNDIVEENVAIGKEGIECNQFMAQLRSRLPFLDGGERWREVLTQLQRPWRKFSENEVSPSLSLALLQMWHEETIRLENRSDARFSMFLLGRGGRQLERFTHVIIGGRDA